MKAVVVVDTPVANYSLNDLIGAYAGFLTFEKDETLQTYFYSLHRLVKTAIGSNPHDDNPKNIISVTLVHHFFCIQGNHHAGHL